ncbi:CoA-binding protein [Dactylosporangium sp. NPDC051485]|uniref:succinate--CoA ligase subunit alpha n=1 Tax=Dactylosporangium sp. NPDC051485 TaxID=3154846 RepID=UPI003445596C
MSVIVSAESRVAIVGISGRFGSFSVRDLRAYGTKVVAGVSQSRAGGSYEGVPIFGTIAEAVRDAGADVGLIYVPAEGALDAVLEAIESGCRAVVYPGDGLPVADAIELRAAAQAAGVWLIGPNTPGLISPGQSKVGFMPSHCYTPGPVGVISRSGSLSYEACKRLTLHGLGQTTVVGIGGDPVKGLTAGEAIELFHGDSATDRIVYLGEIGGVDEYAVAEYASRPEAKPVIALLVGKTAPPGKKMGHAAAMIGGHRDSWEAKVAALRAAGVRVATSLELLPKVTQDAK